MKKKNSASRIMALVLAPVLVMTLALAGLPVRAATEEPAEPCANHLQHDVECGYVEATEVQPCNHIHSSDCGYVEGTEASPCAVEAAHEHDGTCGYDGQAEQTCTFTHTHDTDCGYVEAVEAQPCAHQHDEACGYAEAATGAPCTHSCELCAPTQPTAKAVTAFADLAPDVQTQTVESGAMQTDLTLPATLLATVDGAENTEIAGVTWECAAYDDTTGMTETEYEWTPVLPEGYALDLGTDEAGNANLPPNITAQVAGTQAPGPLMMPMASSGDTIDVGDSTSSSGTNWTYDDTTHVFTVTGNVTITGTTTTNSVVVTPGTDATITLQNASITSTGCAFDMAGTTVHLLLSGDNTLASGGVHAGLRAPDGSTLTIDEAPSATGTLTASAYWGAGIGGSGKDYYSAGGPGETGGAITINGGTVNASSDSGAGIGGGFGGSAPLVGGSGGIITINGGTVNATGFRGAGIGGGGSVGINGTVGGAGGTITINGGIVTATGGRSSGGPSAISGGAGIGGGYGNAAGAGGTITINGGTVHAMGLAFGADNTCSGAGIGGGGAYVTTHGGGAGGRITITGGIVNASSNVGIGAGGAGIGGGGGGGAGGTITITGGTVNATAGGSSCGAGIGGGASTGSGSAGGNITITGGTVTAAGSTSGSAGIGGGVGPGGGAGGTILIYGENTVVIAKNGGHGAQDIGGSGGGGAAGTIFAALPAGKLLGRGDAQLGNPVVFTAAPPSVGGTVSATLPAPFDTAGAGNGTINLLTGLGSGAAGKTLSVLTTFTTEQIPFALTGYTASPSPITGTYLMTTGATVHFAGNAQSIGFAANGVTANGVTAMGSVSPQSPVTNDAVTVTITLSGTATAAGTHTVGLSSATLGTGAITPPATVTKTVAAGQAMAAGDTFAFTFTMPATAVNDLVVTHSFVPSSDKAITAFTLAGVPGNIDEGAGTITLTLPYGTDVTALTPAITHTGASVSPSGAQNFTSPVTYTVTAADGTTKRYVVTVTVAQPGSHTIAFNANGGTVSPASATTGTDGKLAGLPTPTRDRYTFGGWFTAATGGTRVTAGTVFTAAATIYAQWTEKPSPAPTYEYRTLRDEATGVTLTGWFTPGTTLNVTQSGLHAKGTCAACDEIRAAGNRVALYDVSITGSHNGNVELALPVPSGYNGKQMQVWHCKGDHVEKMTLTVKDGYVTGTFSSLSPFAVFATGSGGAPQTGDSSNIWLWSLIGTLALAGFGGLLLRRRKAIRQK